MNQKRRKLSLVRYTHFMNQFFDTLVIFYFHSDNCSSISVS
jgi:hypothetical protein